MEKQVNKEKEQELCSRGTEEAGAIEEEILGIS